ncbi:MAG: HAMP domain-containing histidine kinase, partial [Bacteroidetes bacterium]|nr:HAMP domain-containing histidine kinase [Bacteroidota bacterium]
MAVLIGVASVVYTNFVVKQLAKEENARVKLNVEAIKLSAQTQDVKALTFLAEILKSNSTIPVIITDSTKQINTDSDFRNLDSAKVLDTAYLKKKLVEMKNHNEAIPLESEFSKQYLFYDDSSIVVMLKYYPYLQLLIISLFIFVAYLAFSSSRRFEQNQVWVGMSKETAHQLGTPLSSLMAWVAYLRSANGKLEPTMVNEIEKDVLRLETITDRFSKVGSQPKLEPHNMVSLLNDSIGYLQKRVSQKVAISISPESD